jgi:hypothetical protein
MAEYVIPLTAAPNQYFDCTIPVNGQNRSLRFNVRYNDIGKYWWLEIRDPQTNEFIADNIVLVPGESPAADLLEQLQYLGLGSAAIIDISGGKSDRPDDTNLGVDFVLVWGDSVGAVQ